MAVVTAPEIRFLPVDHNADSGDVCASALLLPLLLALQAGTSLAARRRGDVREGFR